MQVRSLASETARQSEHADLPSLAWFAADFQEEMSAFDGSLLVQLPPTTMFTCQCFMQFVAHTGQDPAWGCSLFLLHPRAYNKPLNISASQDVMLTTRLNTVTL